jgi:membrane associated rhomboid family serine protease
MVIPIHDDNSQVKIMPAMTWGLIIVNSIIFLTWQLPQSMEQMQQTFFQYGMVPAEYTIHQDLPPYVPFPYWYTLVTMMFLHGNFLHLFGNMLYLWIFGDNVEQAFGHLRFLLFYLLCGIGAAYFHILFNPMSFIPSVGASGAISGVLAAYMVLFPKEKVVLATFFGLMTVPAVALIGFWVAIQLFNAIMVLTMGAENVGIAYMAHLGGFVVGLPIALLLKLSWHMARRNARIGSDGY